VDGWLLTFCKKLPVQEFLKNLLILLHLLRHKGMKSIILSIVTLLSFQLVTRDCHADDQLPRGHFTLTGVEVVPIDRSVVDEKVNDHKSNTLTHWIRFDVHAKFTVLDDTKAKPFKITNPTEMSKCSLTVNKPIRFKGKEVPAGANLLKHQQFDGSFLNVSMTALSPQAVHSIRIREDFTFPPDTYTLRFQWETSDGEKFTDTVTVRISVESKKEQRERRPLPGRGDKAEQDGADQPTAAADLKSE